MEPFYEGKNGKKVDSWRLLLGILGCLTVIVHSCCGAIIFLVSFLSFNEAENGSYSLNFQALLHREKVDSSPLNEWSGQKQKVEGGHKLVVFLNLSLRFSFLFRGWREHCKRSRVMFCSFFYEILILNCFF